MTLSACFVRLIYFQNLRRWEVTERKRRKAARESSQSVSATSSLLDDIARRANQIWPNRQNRHSSHNGLGAHTALQSQENFDSVPLDNIHDATSPSLSPSRTSSQDTLRENPFTNPSEAMSPFADPPNPESPTPTPSATRSSPFSKYLDPPSVSRRQPPVPKPLDLPKPRTPPPPVSSLPYASTSPAIAEEHPEVSDENETRWWHDWLCGCGEGPDRGGEHQVTITSALCSKNIDLFSRPVVPILSSRPCPSFRSCDQ